MESLQKKIVIGLASAIAVVAAVIGAFYFSNRNKEQESFEKVEIVEESAALDMEEAKESSNIAMESETVPTSESSEKIEAVPAATPYPAEETENFPIIAEEKTMPAATPEAENTDIDSGEQEDDEEEEESKPVQEPEDADKPIELPFVPFG